MAAVDVRRGTIAGRNTSRGQSHIQQSHIQEPRTYASPRDHGGVPAPAAHQAADGVRWEFKMQGLKPVMA